MNVNPLRLHGCYKIELDPKADYRGYLVKAYQSSVFKDIGFTTEYVEDFYTLSNRDVIRGMHFQLPPKALNKIVYCLYGIVLDVFLDLRTGSPTYLQYEGLTLGADKPYVLYLPTGIAHGFMALSEKAIMCYKVDQEYDPDLDSGIRWDSFGYTWPVNFPIVSQRDQALPKLDEFVNPFKFSAEK
jgi:dTDP-4-dehydrorhamnose 3,5-epimerase